MENPLVSIIIPTYNRAKIVGRAISSALNQTYENIDVIIIDDGSSDNTAEILNCLNDPRIRLFKHEKNKGVAAAKNTGLRNIIGDWFTILDSDDEIVSDAIEIMMSIPLHFDQSVTSVTCNCLDTVNKELSGKGLKEDQYFDTETIVSTCDGEFWGLTKSSLLGNDYFIENFSGFESVLWYKINDRSKKYYIHKPLRIYHTEGDDRVSMRKAKLYMENKLFIALLDETDFLNTLKKYNPDNFMNMGRVGLIVTRINNDNNAAAKYLKYLNSTNKNTLNTLIFQYRLVAVMMKKIDIGKSLIKAFIDKYFVRIGKNK